MRCMIPRKGGTNETLKDYRNDTCDPDPALALFAASLELAVGAWYVKPDGDLSYSPNGVVTDLDLEDRFGFDSEWEAMFRAKIEPGELFGVYLKATPWDSTRPKTTPSSLPSEIQCSSPMTR